MSVVNESKTAGVNHVEPPAIGEAPGTLELTRFKRGIIRSAMPANSALVFGDMYVVEGYYTRYCLEMGCKISTLVDMIETPNFNRHREADRRLNFYKGNFADPLFMRSLHVRAEVGVLFDILLHQAALSQALHEICRHVSKRLCIVQPTIEELEHPQSLVFLPGNSKNSLAPSGGNDPLRKVFEPRNTNPAHWMWAITRTALVAMLECEGFKVVEERRLDGYELLLPWYNIGLVAERVSDSVVHWTENNPVGNILSPWW